MSPPFFQKTRRFIHQTCIWYSVFLFVVILAIILLQVLLRNILGIPMPWAEEATIYMMISLALFASVFVMIEKGHLFVDMILNKFTRLIRQIVVICMLLVQIVFIGTIIYFSFISIEYASKVHAISLGISMQLPYLSIPLAFSCMFFELCIQFVEALYDLFIPQGG